MKEARGLTPYLPPPRADSDARKWNGRTRGDHAPANTGASPVEGGCYCWAAGFRYRSGSHGTVRAGSTIKGTDHHGTFPVAEVRNRQ
jgi:hypothetical protein